MTHTELPPKDAPYEHFRAWLKKYFENEIAGLFGNDVRVNLTKEVDEFSNVNEKPQVF